MNIESEILRAINEDSTSDTEVQPQKLDDTIINAINNDTDDELIESEIKRENKVRITLMILGMTHNPIAIFDTIELRRYYNSVRMQVVKSFQQGTPFRVAKTAEHMARFKAIGLNNFNDVMTHFKLSKKEFKLFMENGYISYILTNSKTHGQDTKFVGSLHLRYYFKSNSIWIYQPTPSSKGKVHGNYASLSLFEMRILKLDRIYPDYSPQVLDSKIKVPISAFALMMGDIQEGVKYDLIQ